MGKCQRNEEREFYLRMTLQERWGKRDLDRQIAGGLDSTLAATDASEN